MADNVGTKVTREFSHEQLLDEIEIRYNSSGAVILHEIVETQRWSILHRVVFFHDGALWQVNYNEPATEYQEGQEVFYENPVVAVQVRPKTVTTVSFVPVVKRS